MKLASFLQPASLRDSLGVYVPAVVLQKAIGLGRMLVFLYLMNGALEQYNLWALGLMILTVASPLLALGANQGLVRYATLYESRGELRRFWRQAVLPAALLAVAVTSLAFLASRPITAFAIASKDQGWNVTDEQVRLCQLALANGLLLALYNNVLGMMYGLRTYRLAAAMDMLFTVLFTAMSVALLSRWPLGMTVLWTHLGSLAVALIFGAALLQMAISRMETPATATREALTALSEDGAVVSAAEEMEPSPTIVSPVPKAPAAPGKHPLQQVLLFGLWALIGTMLWNSLGYVSYFLTNKYIGPAPAARFSAWSQLAQPVLFLSNAVWSVAFSHVLKRWESDSPQAAMRTLEGSYKLAGLLTMTLTVAVYVTAPGWSGLLPSSWRLGLEMLGGLLMFFQVMSQLAIVTVLARLHERPIAIGWVALVGGVANAMLALWLIPTYGTSGAAWAAGAGVYIGGGTATLLYLLWTRTRLDRGSYLLLASPILLVLGPVLAAIAWTVLLVVTLATNLVLDAQQKRELARRFRR